MKKKGKKLISIALTVAMIAGLTACGKGNGGTETAAAVRPMPALQNSMYLRNRPWISIWIQTI
ncbi:MAG: hypothetical protein ACLU77_06075 [Waltera sp.]